jgi:hypothetical protein
MKYKDQLIMEELMNQVGIDSNNNENEELFIAIAAEFISRANPSDKIFSLLNQVKEKGIVPELVEFLNQLGKEDENNWVAKDKLIKFLFQYYK